MISVGSGAAVSDLSIMESARGLYAEGKLGPAIEKYSQIQPSSDFWLDSIEERAWSHTRRAEYESALADLQSITSPVWTSQVGPETFMLSTFVSLKICAFKDVVKKVAQFKEIMLPRVESLQTMIRTPLSASFLKLAEPIKRGQVTMASLGKSADKFPRYFYRDKKLISALRAAQNSLAQERLIELAKEDLAEIELNLKKMKVIEVELIQKVLMADANQKNQNKRLKFGKIDRDKELVFPVNDDEVWVDEVGHYQVKANQCPYSTPSARSSL
jgi:hypothetical protein